MANDLAIQARFFERLAELSQDDVLATFMLADVYNEADQENDAKRTDQLARGRADRLWLPKLILFSIPSIALAVGLNIAGTVQNAGMLLVIGLIGPAAWNIIRGERHRRLQERARQLRARWIEERDMEAELREGRLAV